jgi:hypothetical protein
MAAVIDADAASTGVAQLVAELDDLVGAVAGAVRVTGVTVNGVPVVSFDAAGGFFQPVTIAAGANRFVVAATDAAGQRVETTLTVVGVEPAAGPDWAQFRDVTLSGQLVYQTTTFNRQTRTLYTDARLENTGAQSLAGPIGAVFDQFTPPSVAVGTGSGVFSQVGSQLLSSGLLNAADLGKDSRPLFVATAAWRSAA